MPPLLTPTDDPLSLVQYLDMKTYLVGDILTKVDRASMAHALEVREPLLDHELMGWVSGLPTDLKLKGTEGKYLLKKAMEPDLPHDVLYRKKMGFSVPLAAWFPGPLAVTIGNVVLGERLACTGMFNQDYLREVVHICRNYARVEKRVVNIHPTNLVSLPDDFALLGCCTSS